MYTFKHMKTPGWSPVEFSIYHAVIDENDEIIGYIGLQDLDLARGICGNLCYKTDINHRGKGKSKQYLKEFLELDIYDIDVYKACVMDTNVASRKMLEFAGFKLEKIVLKKSSYVRKRFDN